MINTTLSHNLTKYYDQRISRKIKSNFRKYRSYLVQEKTGEWQLKHLNLFQFLFRNLFGCFKQTHSKEFLQKINNEFKKGQYLDPKKESVIKSIDKIFERIYKKNKIQNDHLLRHVFSFGLFKDQIIADKVDIGFAAQVSLNGVVAITATDEESRVKFVNYQNAIEETLLKYKKEGLLSIEFMSIHTPSPATPFCLPAGENDISLLDPSMQNDPNRKMTIDNRAITVRQLVAEGVNYILVHEKNRRSARKDHQLTIFDNTLKNNKNVKAYELTGPIDQEKIGATAIFTIGEEKYIFSLKGRQANAPQDHVEWKVWLSSIAEKEGKERHEEMIQFFNDCQIPLN